MFLASVVVHEVGRRRGREQTTDRPSDHATGGRSTRLRYERIFYLEPFGGLGHFIIASTAQSRGGKHLPPGLLARTQSFGCALLYSPSASESAERKRKIITTSMRLDTEQLDLRERDDSARRLSPLACDPTLHSCRFVLFRRVLLGRLSSRPLL